MRNRLLIFIFLILFSFFHGCSSFGNNDYGSNEFVMFSGMTINATNKNGSITIKAISKFEREFIWKDNNIKVSLVAREKRWYGSLGAYYSGGGRRIHAVIEEGQQHFCSESEALDWLIWRNEQLDYVYSSNGLVIGWYTQKDEKSDQIALAVKIWQIYINGDKPNDINDSQNNMIEVRLDDMIDNLPSSMTKSSFVPSKSTIIKGRKYSGKSIDYLNDPAIHGTPDLVEKTISTGGKKSYASNDDLTFYYLLGDEMFWVLLDKDGSVILVGR